MNSTFEYIPTHNYEKHYANALARFLARTDVSQRNKDLVTTYLRDAAIGKTVKGSAKTKIGFPRRQSYLNNLGLLIDFVKKDLDQVTIDDMQRFIEALEGGQILSRKRFITGRGYFTRGAPVSPRYAVEIKMNIRRYYKYLLGNCVTYPALVDWIDVSNRRKEVQALTPAQVQQLIDHARTVRDRALIQTLFDGGFRLGELLNIRLQHVTFREVDKGQRCFFLRAPYSKTIPRTVVLPMPDSTKWITYWLQEHPAKPTMQDDGTLATDSPDAQLFPMTANSVHTVFSTLAKAVLGRHVWPHLMRHTSATYWANKLDYFKFCKRFGWTMTSAMPRVYIDAAGIDELDTARIYHQASETDREKREHLAAKMMAAVKTVLEDAR